MDPRNTASQIAEASGDQSGLGQALAAILPHVVDDECPVCGRDFREVSDTSLRAHISQEIARLVEEAERLQLLVRERQNVQASLAHRERDRSALAAAILEPHIIAQQQQRLAFLQNTLNTLTELAAETLRGEAVRRR